MKKISFKNKKIILPSILGVISATVIIPGIAITVSKSIDRSAYANFIVLKNAFQGKNHWHWSQNRNLGKILLIGANNYDDIYRDILKLVNQKPTEYNLWDFFKNEKYNLHYVEDKNYKIVIKVDEKTTIKIKNNSNPNENHRNEIVDTFTKKDKKLIWNEKIIQLNEKLSEKNGSEHKIFNSQKSINDLVKFKVFLENKKTNRRVEIFGNRKKIQGDFDPHYYDVMTKINFIPMELKAFDPILFTNFKEDGIIHDRSFHIVNEFKNMQNESFPIAKGTIQKNNQIYGDSNDDTMKELIINKIIRTDLDDKEYDVEEDFDVKLTKSKLRFSQEREVKQISIWLKPQASLKPGMYQIDYNLTIPNLSNNSLKLKFKFKVQAKEVNPDNYKTQDENDFKKDYSQKTTLDVIDFSKLKINRFKVEKIEQINDDGFKKQEYEKEIKSFIHSLNDKMKIKTHFDLFSVKITNYTYNQKTKTLDFTFKIMNDYYFDNPPVISNERKVKVQI